MFTGFLLETLTATAISSVLVGIGVWISRSWISERLKSAIKNEYDEKLETHKAQLKAQSDVELERLRSELAIAAGERHVRFSKLHERRLDLITETYARLRDLHTKLENYVKIFEPTGDKPKEERRKEAADAHKEFIEYYAPKRIFIPRSTTEKLDKINQEFVKSYYQFLYSVDITAGQKTGGVDKWMEVFTRVNEEIAEALSELEDEFRALLGDES